ncbi:hypothetical protein ABVT39_000621 [Epinephelus coioides]
MNSHSRLPHSWRPFRTRCTRIPNRYSTLASDGDPDAGTADAAAAAPSPPTGAAPAAPHLEGSASASNGAVAPSPPTSGTPAAPCMDGSVSSSLAPVVAAGPDHQHRLPRLLHEALKYDIPCNLNDCDGKSIQWSFHRLISEPLRQRERGNCCGVNKSRRISGAVMCF